MTYNGINNIPRDGLVGEFLLDGNGDDTSGNGNNGTATDVTWISADRGYVKECGSFNGSSSKVDVPDNLLDGTIFSVSVIISDKGNSSDTDGKIIDFRNSGKDNYFTFFHDDSDGTIQLVVDFGTSNQVKIGNVNEGYKHYGFTRNGDTLKIYKEGILINTLSVGTNSFTGASGMIGQESDDGAVRHFNGDIGLVRIYNSVITPSEINSLYIEGLRKLGPGIMQQYPELFKGCVGYWDFREGNLSNLIDGTNATNNGATLTTDHLGYANNAMYFGTGDTRINTVCNVNPIFTHTIICKVVNDSGDNDQVLIECYNGSNSNNRSFISLNRKSDGSYLAGSIAFFGNDGSTNTNLSPDTDLGINDGNWHIVSWTRDSANTNKMYLDGTEITGLNGSIQSGDITSSFAKQTHFGRYYSQTAAGLDGSISAIIINNRALLSAEISQLHNLLMEKYIYPNPRYTPQSLPKPALYINGNHSGTTWYDSSGNGNNATSSGTPFNIGQLKGISLSSQDMTWNDTGTIGTSTCYENISGKWTFMKNPSYITSTGISSTTKDLVNIRIFSETLSDKQIQELYYAEKGNFIN